MSTPKEFSKDANKITFDFIWNYKPAKKKGHPYHTKNSWWLGHDKALNLNWVKQLCSNSNAPWQYIPKIAASRCWRYRTL